MKYTIRIEKENERYEVENLVRNSFWDVYQPGCSEHFVLHTLRNNENFIKELDLVLLLEEKIIGQAAAMKAEIITDDGKIIPVITIGPICILPQYQGSGYGKILLDHCIDIAMKLDYGAILLEGNVDFYSKCGFTYARNYNIKYHDLPEDADSSFFLCKELKENYLRNVSGTYYTPQCYFVDEKDVEEFDKQFPHKEKHKLPSQIF